MVPGAALVSDGKEICRRSRETLSGAKVCARMFGHEIFIFRLSSSTRRWFKVKRVGGGGVPGARPASVVHEIPGMKTHAAFEQLGGRRHSLSLSLSLSLERENTARFKIKMRENETRKGASLSPF